MTSCVTSRHVSVLIIGSNGDGLARSCSLGTGTGNSKIGCRSRTDGYRRGSRDCNSRTGTESYRDRLCLVVGEVGESGSSSRNSYRGGSLQTCSTHCPGSRNGRRVVIVRLVAILVIDHHYRLLREGNTRRGCRGRRRSYYQSVGGMAHCNGEIVTGGIQSSTICCMHGGCFNLVKCHRSGGHTCIESDRSSGTKTRA